MAQPPSNQIDRGAALERRHRKGVAEALGRGLWPDHVRQIHPFLHPHPGEGSAPRPKPVAPHGGVVVMVHETVDIVQVREKLIGQRAVSYTHLDVYKRQTYSSITVDARLVALSLLGTRILRRWPGRASGAPPSVTS